MSGRKPIVVLGLMTTMPVAGVMWQTLHYLLGFEALGYAAYYVEMHARTPSMLMRNPEDDSSARAAGFLAATMRRFGFADRWGFQALHRDEQCYGLSRSELEQLFGSAELIINLHGGTFPRPELADTGRLVYLETDPVQAQAELAQGQPAIAEFLERHCALFTFAENYGAEDCRLPRSDRFDFWPTRQPVVCNLWTPRSGPSRRDFTTIGNWRQHWREVWLDGENYTWSKEQEFDRVLALPDRIGPRLELALASYTDEDERRLTEHGWKVISALEFSTDLERYRDYIHESYGEFTVAKDQNVRLRSGWFSDRSATYLASGRPVITQDTGFGRAVPTGEGLFAFSSIEEVAEAAERIDHDPEAHRRAARELALEFFSAQVVLGEMLAQLGAPSANRTGGHGRLPLPANLVLTPISRRPLILPEATLQHARNIAPVRRASVSTDPPLVSVVVVSHNELPLTKLCLETVLAERCGPEFELLTVDNGSQDGTAEYLAEVAELDPRVHVVANRRNHGFAAACNQGLALAQGGTLVLLNNDTMVAPGWLGRLSRHLEDERVGLLGAVTNRIGNEAEVPTVYETWGGFLQEARRRAQLHRRVAFKVPTVTMFCLAMRGEVHAELGPLDDGYGLGTLEDDDYSMRARHAGYSLVCAEDVLVHHFGEGTFGQLYASGERDRILGQNKKRFERRWGEPWRPYGRRTDPAYERSVDELQARLASCLPPDCTLLVVSKGDERLIEVPGRRACHFPATPIGAYAGHHPADSSEAIAEVERMRASGATHIAFPSTALWWLEHYEGLASHLDTQYRVLFRDASCALFALSASAPGVEPSGVKVSSAV